MSTRFVLAALLVVVVAGCGSAASAGSSTPPPGVPPATSGTTTNAVPTTSTVPSAVSVPVAVSAPGVAARNPVQSSDACSNLARIATWTVSRRAAQLIVAPVSEDDLQAAEPLVAAGVGGLLLFGSSAPATLGAQIHLLDAAAPDGLAPIVMTDEEGGEVQRMANLVGSLPWPRTMAETMSSSAVESLARTVGRRMRAAGVTMDLAPVLDLSDSPGPDAEYPDGPRSFGTDPTVTGNYGVAFAEGLLQAGVVPVVKHFPGLGEASYNTDDGPATDPPLASLEDTALVPFRAAIAAKLPAVMVSLVTVPGLTGGLPASLSKAAVTGVLRDQLGFKGLVLTDSLSAGAVTAAGYSVAEAAVAAVEAGVDLLPFDTDDPLSTVEQMISSIEAAVAAGNIPSSQLDEAVEQVLAVKHAEPCS